MKKSYNRASHFSVQKSHKGADNGKDRDENVH